MNAEAFRDMVSVFHCSVVLVNGLVGSGVGF